MRRSSFRAQVLGSLGFALAITGCGQILGLGDFIEGSGGAGATSTNAGGGAGQTTTTSATTSGSGGQGGSGTGGSTTTTTAAVGGNGGTGGAPCVPTGAEDCTKAGDEDCDGIACSDAVWAKVIGSAGEQNSTDVAVDAQGNVILAGFFAGTMTFGNKTLISSGLNDYYLAKLDSAGKPLWALQFGDASENGTRAQVAVDKAGNIFLGGVLNGTANFGSGALSSMGNDDAFLAAFNASGNPLWSKRFGDSNVQRVIDIAVDGSGNVVVAGHFAGTVNFGGGLFLSAGGNVDGYVAKFSPNGSLLVAKQLLEPVGQSSSFQGVTGVAIDSAGSVIIHGQASEIDFGGASLMSGPFFVAKLDSSLNHSWSKSLVTGSQNPTIATDSMGNVFLAGPLVGTMDYDGHPLVGAVHSLYVAKFNSLGLYQWAQPTIGAGPVDVAGLATDASGNAIITGRAFGDTNFGNGALQSLALDGSMYLAKFGPNGGNALWSKMFGGLGQHDPTAIATDPGSKEIVVTGMITQGIDFGTGPLQSLGGYDVVLAKFQP